MVAFSARCFGNLLLLAALVQWVSANYVCTHDEKFVPDAVLRVTAHNISQSCVPSKLTVLVNGTAPGPELRLRAGKRYWIRVYNDITDQNVTMHWHGLTMAVSPFSDGTPLASQWPIPPSHFFDYEIRVPESLAGTYFYHSHVGFQAVSAAGPLIIEEEECPPYNYDGERIVFLSDVFRNTNKVIETGLISSPLSFGGESAMMLINGKGGGVSNGTACNASLSTIDVEPGKTYRFRFIGGTALSFVSLAIEGHDNLTVIEADGSYTKPYSTNFLQVGSGQRFSVLLTTRSDITTGTFRIQVENRDRTILTVGYAILNYGTKPKTPFLPPASAPLTLPPTDRNFLERALSPLRHNNFPSAAEVTRRVTMTVHQNVRGVTTWVDNYYPWVAEFPAEPYLVSLYRKDGIEFPDYNRALANQGIDPVTRAFPARIGEVLEIVIQNTGSDTKGLDSHPFHAHGAHYYDIGSGNGTYDPVANEAKLAGTKPVLRDSTILYRYETETGNGTAAGWRAWRLRVTEPGVWMIHCHTLEHMLMGMQSVWVMGDSEQVLHRVPEPEVQGYLTFGGDVYGNKTHWPHVVHFQDDWEDNQ